MTDSNTVNVIQRDIRIGHANLRKYHNMLVNSPDILKQLLESSVFQSEYNKATFSPLKIGELSPIFADLDDKTLFTCLKVWKDKGYKLFTIKGPHPQVTIEEIGDFEPIVYLYMEYPGYLCQDNSYQILKSSYITVISESKFDRTVGPTIRKDMARIRPYISAKDYNKLMEKMIRRGVYRTCKTDLKIGINDSIEKITKALHDRDKRYTEDTLHYLLDNQDIFKKVYQYLRIGIVTNVLNALPKEQAIQIVLSNPRDIGAEDMTQTLDPIYYMAWITRSIKEGKPPQYDTNRIPSNRVRVFELVDGLREMVEPYILRKLMAEFKLIP